MRLGRINLLPKRMTFEGREGRRYRVYFGDEPSEPGEPIVPICFEHEPISDLFFLVATADKPLSIVRASAPHDAAGENERHFNRSLENIKWTAELLRLASIEY